jgi:hypothetical protein
MAIGSLSEPDQLRASRDFARQRQSLLTQGYRQAKRKGDYMGALAVTELGRKAGLKIGGTVRAEDVAAAGERDYEQGFEKLGQAPPPVSGLDAYKAMQPQARMAQQGGNQATTAATQAAKPAMPSQSDITQQFRDRYKDAETDEDRMGIVSEARGAGVPLSKYGKDMLASRPQVLTPPSPKLTENVGGKIQFTDAGKKYYQGLKQNLPESSVNMLAESAQQRRQRQIRESAGRLSGTMATAMRNLSDIGRMNAQSEAEKAAGTASRDLAVAGLESEQARIKKQTGENLRDQMDLEAKDSSFDIFDRMTGVPKPATQLAAERPDLVAPPRISPPRPTVASEGTYIPTPGPYQLGRKARIEKEKEVNPDEEEYLKGKAEYEKRQKAELERRAKLLAGIKR